jgi:hypothetical protein
LNITVNKKYLCIKDMNHEVMGLKKNEIEFYQPLFTEGVIVERRIFLNIFDNAM